MYIYIYIHIYIYIYKGVGGRTLNQVRSSEAQTGRPLDPTA